MFPSSEEWIASLLRQAPWMAAAAAVAAVASCFWVLAPPAYLITCAAIGACWASLAALGAYVRRVNRFPTSLAQSLVMIVGFIFADDYLKAGSFFGSGAACVPQGFNFDAAIVQGVSVGIGVAFLAPIVFRRWFARFAVKESRAE